MTGGQTALSLGEDSGDGLREETRILRRLPADRPRLRVVRASEAERAAHRVLVAELDAAVEGGSVWTRRGLDPES